MERSVERRYERSDFVGRMLGQVKVEKDVVGRP